MGNSGNIVGDVFGAWGEGERTKKNIKATERQRKANLALFDSLDYEPMYASQLVPPMQRTQSPVARSYLESMLMGSNPDSTMSTRPNAAATKALQQRQQNAMFGTPEARVAQQRALEQRPMYEVATPTRKVGGDDAQRKKQSYIAGHPEAAGIGVTAELERAWIDKFGGKGLQDDPFAYASFQKAIGNGWTPEDLTASINRGEGLKFYARNKK
jgi:hypothetical protein